MLAAIVVLVRFDPGGARYQLTESHAWIRDFGVRYELGVDGIAVVLIALTALLIPFVIAGRLARRRPAGERAAEPRWRPTQGFFALILAVEAMVMISFEATDVFLFYIFFEAMLIPMYFLIGGFGDRAHEPAGRGAAALVRGGEVPALQPGRRPDHAGRGHRPLRGHRAELGTGTFDLQEIVRPRADGTLRHGDQHRALALPRLLLRLRGEGAAVAAAHLAAQRRWASPPPPVAVLITAVVDKVGTFAMLRYCLQLFPEASQVGDAGDPGARA